MIFCLVGFLASAGLLRALWQRYFAEVSIAVVAALTLALGLATSTLLLVARCDVYEVLMSCGYAFTMLALAAIWNALHEPDDAAAGWPSRVSAYGLALGARPSLLFGAAVLLVPVAQAYRERRKLWDSLAAAIGPITVIEPGLMLYNWLRFDSPFDFGLRYQLTGARQMTRQFFGLRYLWFNLRLYFLTPTRWSSQFPFVHDIIVPPFRRIMVGLNRPLASWPTFRWCGWRWPFRWRCATGRTIGPAWAHSWWWSPPCSGLALTISLFFAACARYEVEFLPALVLLSAVGVLSVERALAVATLAARSALRLGTSAGLLGGV